MVQTYDELWDLMTTRSRRSREGERERTRRVTGDDGVGLLLDERRALGDVDVVAAHASDDKGTGGAHVRGGAISLVLVELETDEENQRRGEEDEVVPSQTFETFGEIKHDVHGFARGVESIPAKEDVRLDEEDGPTEVSSTHG